MTDRLAALLALCLLAGAARPALAGSPAPSSAGAADTSSTIRVEEPSRATRSLTEVTPSTRSLALLRTQAGRRVVRVSTGKDDYEFSRARYESSGVVFSPGGREGMPLWAGEDASSISSPIPWERIESIRVRHSHGAGAAVTGALLASFLVINAANHARPDKPMPGTIILAPLAVAAGAWVGASCGGSVFASWPTVWRPGLAESPVPAADSTRATDASSLQTEATAPPAAPRTPSPAEIATIRERVARHDARLHLGGNAYDIRGAFFESDGVAFTPRDLRGVTARDNGGPYDDFTQPEPLASPIAWDRIDRIQVWKPCGLRGALVGAAVGAAAYTVIVSQASRYGDEVGFGAVLLLPLVPIGAVLGSAVGAFQQRTESVWQREPDRSASAPGEHR
jgi:hypothetical protein